jgi:fumarylacetoacetate (FAA) hydrolase
MQYAVNIKELICANPTQLDEPPMKLATRFNHTRDGELLIVSRDLTQVSSATHIAPTLQYALDHWAICQPRLQAAYQALNAGQLATAEPYLPHTLLSPLPRAYQWADGSAYVNHVELVQKARGASLPEHFWHDPLIYQGGGDSFLAPHENIPLINAQVDLDFEAEIAVITNDVPLGASPQQAGRRICLILLVNDLSLRRLTPNEYTKGFGFFQSKPSSAFSPVAITPDELGNAWDGRKLHLPIRSYLNGELFGEPNAGIDMAFDFPTLIAHAAKTRKLGAGTIIGSGTVSNIDPSRGFSCIAEKRMLETLSLGQAKTPYLKAGDHLRIEMQNSVGDSIFGAIDQTVVSMMEPAKAC